MKRPLTSEEKQLCENNLKRLKDEKEYLDFQVEYHEMMINKGLEQNFKRALAEFKNKLRDMKEDRSMTENKIIILMEQIKHGVEVKETTKEE